MSKRYKAVCPNCNSINVVPIAYGLPGFEMREDALKGTVGYRAPAVGQRERLDQFRRIHISMDSRPTVHMKGRHRL